MIKKLPKNKKIENFFILNKFSNDQYDDNKQIIVDFSPFILENGQPRQIIPKVFHNQPHYIDMFATALGLESFELLGIKAQEKRKYEFKKQLAAKQISQIYVPRKSDHYCSVCKAEHREQYKEHIISKKHKKAISSSMANQWILDEARKIQRQNAQKLQISQRNKDIEFELDIGKRYREIDRAIISISDDSCELDSLRKPRKMIKQNEETLKTFYTGKNSSSGKQTPKKIKYISTSSTKQQQIQQTVLQNNRKVPILYRNSDVVNFFSKKIEDKCAHLENIVLQGKKLSYIPTSQRFKNKSKTVPKLSTQNTR